jgi:folate-binding protein YgfZ
MTAAPGASAHTLLDLQAAAGAVPGAGGLPAWYGPNETDAVAREYAAAREGAALVDLSERGALEVSGPHRQKFLHNLLSNDLAGRSAGQGCLAALMDVKGHLIALMRALVATDSVRLELAGDRIPVVERTLLHYKVGAPVRFGVRPTAVLGLLGPTAREVLGRAGAPVRELGAEEHVAGVLAGQEILVARASDLPCGGLVLHAAPEAAAPVWSALAAAGARPLGRHALDALRIEAGRPWYGTDVTEQNLLHETGLLREYHSPSKGCYVGQEVIARLEARGGNVNKALRGLRLSARAAAGAVVSAGGQDAGRVTTAALSPRSGPIAMAYLRRGLLESGTTVEVEGQPARVAALPLEP